MKRRFILFGLGALISIVFLSLGPENRLKNTFFAYIDYFDINKRVITHLKSDNTNFTITAECQLVYFNLSKEDVLSVLENGDVNFKLSNKHSKPCQYYIIEDYIDSRNMSVKFEYCYKLNTVKVMSFNLDGEEVCNS